VSYSAKAMSKRCIDTLHNAVKDARDRKYAEYGIKAGAVLVQGRSTALALERRGFIRLVPGHPYGHGTLVAVTVLAKGFSYVEDREAFITITSAYDRALALLPPVGSRVEFEAGRGTSWTITSYRPRSCGKIEIDVTSDVTLGVESP